jgi:hypothetical protein
LTRFPGANRVGSYQAMALAYWVHVLIPAESRQPSRET